MELIDKFEPTKVLSVSDDENQLCVKKLYQHENLFRIYNYDAINRANYELADYQNGKYTIFNEALFNLYFVKKLKANPKLAKAFNTFVTTDFEPNNFKEFNIKFQCFRRRVNIRVIRLLRKTKKAIWE
jgi:hypothetical protein